MGDVSIVTYGSYGAMGGILTKDKDVFYPKGHFAHNETQLNQGQARGYGHITQQYLIFGRTTGGQHFQLEYLQRYLKNCFASFILKKFIRKDEVFHGLL